MSLIPLDQYRKIMKVLPILCVDLIVQNTRGEYLLIKRANEPKKGRWWVIGGRVLKGETLEAAAARKLKQETGLKAKDMRPVGYFELVKGVNPFGSSVFYHSVSVVFSVTTDKLQTVHLDSQSLGFKFAKTLPVDFYVKKFEDNAKKGKRRA